MMTHHSVMTSSLRIKILKIDKFGDFSCDIDHNSRTDVFRDAISLIINHCDPGVTPADTKCPPAAQRKQAKRSCQYYNYKYLHRKFGCADTLVDTVLLKIVFKIGARPTWPIIFQALSTDVYQVGHAWRYLIY